MAREPIGIAFSKVDKVGVEVAQKLVEMLHCESVKVDHPKVYKWYICNDTHLVGCKDDVVYLSYLDEIYPQNIRAYIVISRHQSISRKPTLSLHYPGNPTSDTDPEHGGKPRQLAWTYPRLAKTLFLAYYKAADRLGLLDNYSFTLEATHHGPTELRKPVIFIEIGSSELEWSDKKAQQALTEAIVKTLERGPVETCTPVIGVGGTHYPEKHTRLMLETDYCYGHIFAKYTLKELDKELMIQAITKSIDSIKGIVVLKVPSKVREIVREVAREFNLKIDVHS